MTLKALLIVQVFSEYFNLAAKGHGTILKAKKILAAFYRHERYKDRAAEGKLRDRTPHFVGFRCNRKLTQLVATALEDVLMQWWNFYFERKK